MQAQPILEPLSDGQPTYEQTCDNTCDTSPQELERCEEAMAVEMCAAAESHVYTEHCWAHATTVGHISNLTSWLPPSNSSRHMSAHLVCTTSTHSH